jgi:hypothetical protein
MPRSLLQRGRKVKHVLPGTSRQNVEPFSTDTSGYDAYRFIHTYINTCNHNPFGATEIVNRVLESYLILTTY